MLTLTDSATQKVAELIEAEGNPELFLRCWCEARRMFRPFLRDVLRTLRWRRTM